MDPVMFVAGVLAPGPIQACGPPAGRHRLSDPVAAHSIDKHGIDGQNIRIGALSLLRIGWRAPAARLRRCPVGPRMPRFVRVLHGAATGQAAGFCIALTPAMA